MNRKSGVLLLWIVFVFSCKQADDAKTGAEALNLPADTLTTDDSSSITKPDTSNLVINKVTIQTGNVQPQQVVDFAKTLIGVKYKYGSTDPAVGFDCSGFITHVFNHFNIKVPRSSIDFTQVGRTVPLDSVKPGDIILFTGTDSTERHIGHMGIITANQDEQVSFIHSTSGKQFGVTITPLNGYYSGRLMRVTRIFAQNDR